MNQNMIVSNEEILDLINEKLLVIQTELFDSNVPNKDRKFKVINCFLSILIILTIVLGLIYIISPLVIYIIGAVIAFVGFIGLKLITNNIKRNTILQRNKEVQNNKDALILQEVRKFIQGKTIETEEIRERLSSLTKEVIDKRK